MWKVDLIEVPGDGSCFFTSISIAMNSCLTELSENEFICSQMSKYIEGYENDVEKDLMELSPRFIRYICSKNIDKCIFDTYVQEAKDRKESGEKHVKMFKTIETMSHHILRSNCWADHSVIRSFFNAFDCKLSIIVFDSSYGGIVYFQKEWTEDKDFYICLQRENNHYRPMSFTRESETLPLCMKRDSIVEVVSYIKETTDASIDNVY